jgi:hypothetical protein
MGDQSPRPFGFAQGKLCLCKKRRDKDGAPAQPEVYSEPIKTVRR